MQRLRTKWDAVLLWSLLPLCLLASAASASPATATPDTGSAASRPTDLWKDPTFQKQFMGSYGFQAELEPRVSPIEREQMEKVLALMGTDLEAAATLLQGATKPESSAVFDFTLGNIRFQQERLDDAAGHYQEAIRKFPSFRRAHKNLGLVEVRLGKPAEAITALTRVAELGGGDALTFGLLGYAFSGTGQFVSGESAFRNAVLMQPAVLDWKLGLTQCVLRQQKYGEAASLCEELITAYPDRADLWLLQANAYIGLNQPMKAAENFEVVAGMGKATTGALYTLGDIYANESLWDPAARAYRLAIENEPDQSPDRPIRSVEILAQRGAATQARVLAEQVRQAFDARLDDAQRKKFLKVQARLAAGEGGAENSAALLEEIVKLDPLDGEALLLLGQHYAKASDPERAIFYYERAEGIDAFEGEAKTRHAQLLVAQSRYAEALPLLKRAQEIRPREDVARYLEQVERVARSQH